jgi:NAD(P)-dependent dehydrogenase (short-subunit alcohol dehydrogenase family)
MSSFLITGAGRGLGLELVNQLSKLSKDQVSIVFAATRSKDPSEGLKKAIDASNGRVAHILLPVTDKAGIAAAVTQLESQLGSNGLDVLINNAGILPYTPGGTAAMTDLRETFEVNVEAVHNTTVALLPLVKKSNQKKVVNM